MASLLVQLNNKRRQSPRRVTHFRMIDGVGHELRPSELSPRVRPTQSTVPRINLGGLKQGKDEGLQSPWVKNAKKVLRFYAYFLETVQESSLENFRTRQCTIYYYLEDNTMGITEQRVENSGIPQGSFIKRGEIPKNPEGDPFLPEDLRVGSDITIYGRTFHITDCDTFTREWDPTQPPAQQSPRDSYNQLRDLAKNRDTGADLTVFRGKRQNPLKRFMEASLGNAAPRQRGAATNDGLRQFLDHDRRVLQFHCVWDDSRALFGDKHHYKLHYFLADDTLEVREVHQPNSGYDPYPCLLSRQRLAKDLAFAQNQDVLRGVEEQDPVRLEGEFVRTDDLRVGGTFYIQGRAMLVYGCDAFTERWWAENKGEQLRPLFVDVSVPTSEATPVPDPPYSGFGEEQDSLASHRHLVPRVPKKDFHRMMANEGKVLRLQARMRADTVSPFDQSRRFVVMYHLADDTITVYEPPQRNAGSLGGKYLKRGRIRNPDGGFYVAADLEVGRTLKFSGGEFELLAADDYTLTYMESSPGEFPFASVARVEGRLKEDLGADYEALRAIFVAGDEDNSGWVRQSDFISLLRAAGEAAGGDPRSPHELLTLFRVYDVNKDGRVNYDEFCRSIAGLPSLRPAPVTAEDLSDDMSPDQIEDYVATITNTTLSGREEMELERVMKDFAARLYTRREESRLREGFAAAAGRRGGGAAMQGTHVISMADFGQQLQEVASLTERTVFLLKRKFYPQNTTIVNYHNFFGIVRSYLESRKKGRLY